MTRWHVYGSVTFVGWVELDADTLEEALNDAESTPASEWDFDRATATVELNVEPQVESL